MKWQNGRGSAPERETVRAARCRYVLCDSLNFLRERVNIRLEQATEMRVHIEIAIRANRSTKGDVHKKRERLILAFYVECHEQNSNVNTILVRTVNLRIRRSLLIVADVEFSLGLR